VYPWDASGATSGAGDSDSHGPGGAEGGGNPARTWQLICVLVTAEGHTAEAGRGRGQRGNEPSGERGRMQVLCGAGPVASSLATEQPRPSLQQETVFWTPTWEGFS